MEKTYWVYILASALGGTLYIGVTNDLVRRIYEHRAGVGDYWVVRRSLSSGRPKAGPVGGR
jgi:putative endonuclease